jgi:antibiotic biosynthesis monooxygenase (ABM) superfamily enzyme
MLIYYSKEATMTIIATDQEVVTLVNVFTVTPDRQQQLIDELVEATRSVMRRLPGYVSANIHRSLDGSRVVNYAQWRRQEDFQAMLRDPVATEHRNKAQRLAISVEPHLHDVVFIDHADQ